jgi:microcystin degradation protein MlrC
VKVAIGGIMHESNSFSPGLTGLDAFTIHREDEINTWWQEAHHEVGGFIEGGRVYGFEVIPTLMAQATPSGTVAAAAFEALTGELVDRLQLVPQMDGLLLALHGAMVAEGYPDGDGEIVRRVRLALGEDFPIVVTHDYHANISETLVKNATALVIYKTNPHLDQRERGLQAAAIIPRIIRGKARPVQALRKPPMLLNIFHHNTSKEPMKSIMDAACAAERNPRILAASVAAGYQYADVYEMSPSVVVVTDDDQALAEREADRLAGLLWNSREQLTVELPDAAQAVRQAMQSPQSPVVLVEMGDNIGGGSAGDSTVILSQLLSQKASGWTVVLADPEAARACHQAGVDAVLTLQVGGKLDDLHGSPVAIHGRVKCLHDGRYLETEPRHGGRRYREQGLTAVLEVAGSTIDAQNLLVLTTHREPPFSLHQLLSVGIQPQRQKILVVKAAVAFRAAYEPIAGRIIEVDTPGLTAVNPARFDYVNVRRPLWGLDADVEYNLSGLQ